MKKTLSFLICFLSTASNALILEDLIEKGTLLQTLHHKKVGYYTGSFNPFHKGHEKIPNQVLEKGLCDYVLVVPAWSSDDAYKTGRIDVQKRLDMLFSVFADHPHVIVTRMTPLQMQEALTCLDEGRTVNDKPTVKSKIEGLEFIGIMGSDKALSLPAMQKELSAFMAGIKVPQKYKEHTIGGIIALPVKEFIVSLRQGDDLTPLHGHIGNRPISAIIESESERGLSSTLVREAVKKGEPTHAMVSQPVKEIIVKDKLYQ